MANWRGKVEAVIDFVFLDFKITTDGDCSHEIKRLLLLGRKAMINLDSVLKNRDITDKGPSSQSCGFSSNHVWMILGPKRRLSAEELTLLNCGVGEDSWESLGLQGDPTSPFWRRPALGFLWKEWCWSWNSNTLATWCKEPTHLKGPWCWEWLKAGGEGDDRGWDGWMASPTRWIWVWASSGSCWKTGKPGVLQSMGSQRVRHDWDSATELNWTNTRT